MANNPDYEAAQALKEARGYIDQGWTQYALSKVSYEGYFNNIFKYRVHRSYCAVGAIQKAVGPGNPELRKRMKIFIYEGVRRTDKGGISIFGIEIWNDTAGRTKEEVLAAFDVAIKLAEEGWVEEPVFKPVVRNPNQVSSLAYAYQKFFEFPAASLIQEKPKPKKKKLNVISDVQKFVNSLPEPEPGYNPAKDVPKTNEHKTT